jgi:4-oxalocrotonate tautomerase
MPYVNIRITREGGTTSQQKALLIAGVSQLLLDVLKKPLTDTMVVIDEIELDNWGVGGLPVEAFRRSIGRTAAS